MAVLISYHVLGVQLSGSKISLFQGSCVGGRGKKNHHWEDIRRKFMHRLVVCALLLNKSANYPILRLCIQ